MDEYLPGMAGPLKPPKNGHCYQFLVSARVSDPRPGKQNETSLEDQESQARGLIKKMTSMPVEITVIAGSGSGELLTRDELLDLKDKIRTGKFDVVLTEDLGRIARDVEAYHVCGMCEDYDTRLISLPDSVDTLDPNWGDAAFFTSYFYRKENREKSRRCKERKRSRFQAGGDLPDPIFGYIKPEGAKFDGEMSKDPNAEWVYKEWFRKLDAGATFTEIADWLNDNHVSLPPCARKGRWIHEMVARHTFNPILKGRREHNKRKTRRRNDIGKYVSTRADPEELLFRDVPHLAFFEPGYYDRVVAKVQARNAKFRRKSDGRFQVGIVAPKRRVRFPGRVTFCGICGWRYVFGGHGQTDRMMCDGARHYACWNSVTFDASLATQKITAAIWDQIERLADFDAAYLQQIQAQAREADTEIQEEVTRINRQLRETETELANLVKFVREGCSSAAIAKEIEKAEAKQARLQGELHERQDEAAEQELVLPPLEQLKEMARAAFGRLAEDQDEFPRAMRTLIPKLVVFPVRLRDGGVPMLRAQFRLHLAPLLSSKRQQQALAEP
ncbi:MAG: recombinase family protein, partial [bacterium]